VLYEAGLPPPMLSVITGDPKEIADEMLTNERVDIVTFTGGVPIGKYIAAKAVYKRQVLELGGNDPIVVMDDADVAKAADLAANGSYKNSAASAARPSSASSCTRRSPPTSPRRCWPRRAAGPTATRWTRRSTWAP
jgi:acyl-CoA reductase-like NAD-dependent aldehyde dehydrogenase